MSLINDYRNEAIARYSQQSRNIKNEEIPNNNFNNMLYFSLLLIKYIRVMRKFYTLALLFLALSPSAQQGGFLLTNHFPRHSNLDNFNFDIVNDLQGRICIANRSGILKYDGDAWDFYTTPSAALSLAVDSSNVVYAGCIGSVGKIDFANGKIQYRELVASDSLDDLFLETYFAADNIYFVGNKTLVVFNTIDKSVKRFDGDFINAYTLDNRVFINTVDGGVYAVSDSLEAITRQKSIARAHKIEGNPDIVLDYSGELFSYENEAFGSLPHNKLIKERGYEIQDVRWINKSLFVCSTFRSGLLFLNIEKPDYMEISDYHSGLPDNEIFAIHTDNSSEVWAAHEFGITQISPLFPAYSYSRFPGLNGNLTGAGFYKDNLWVTTSIGVFYFDRDTIFETKVYYETVSKEKRKVTSPALPLKKDKPKKEKSVLKRLFGKKNRANQADKNKEPKGMSKAIAKLKTITNVFKKGKDVGKVRGKLDEDKKYIRRTKKIPVDIKYSFRPVEGANGKFLSLLSYKDKLLAIGTSGVYEIKDQGAETVIEENIQTYTLNGQNQLILSTSDLQLKFYKLLEEVWVEQIRTETDDIIVQIKEDSKNNLWLAGSNNIYKAQSNDSTFKIVSRYPLNNTYLDKVSLYEINEKPYFINSQGYFYYDRDLDEVVEDQRLRDSIGVPIRHLYDNIGQVVWVYNGKFWTKINRERSIFTNEYLGLFPDLRSIHSNHHSDQLWLITQNNDILKYDPSQESRLGNFRFFLKKVSNEQKEYDQNEKFKLSYNENYLSVELSKPDFLGFLNPEFQYKMVGLNTEWSDWTRSKTIDFSYLSEGDYELLIRARDAFGRIEESSVLEFAVKPPYWQTPWFYAIQVLFFSSLVLYSTRLNQNNSKNRLLSGGLTILTLVLIIEFLQSAISSYFTFKSTPVVEFLIDAMIAFMIFPLERILRELMTQGKVSIKIKRRKSQALRSDTTSE